MAGPEIDLEPDVVVAGAGLAGSVLAAEIIRASDSARVLLLDAGPWVTLDHGQADGKGELIRRKLSRARFRSSSLMAPTGFVEAVGGTSLVWTGWSPRPRPSELHSWPLAAVSDLESRYLDEAERCLRVSRWRESGWLYDWLRTRLEGVGVAADGDPEPGADGLAAPLGLSAAGHTYSPLTGLVEILSQDARSSQRSDRPRIQVISRCRVHRLVCRGGAVVGFETSQGPIDISSSSAVVLAANLIESTRLVQIASGQQSLAGTRLSGHVLASVALLVPIPAPRSTPELATLLLPAAGGGRHLHVQLRAAAGKVTSEVASKMPGLYGSDLQIGPDRDHMLICLTAVGEMPSGDGNLGQVRASAHPEDADNSSGVEVFMSDAIFVDCIWDAMDDLLERISENLSENGTLYGLPWGRGQFGPDLPPRLARVAGGRRWGSFVHPSGSLWMAEPGQPRVTDGQGKVDGFDNLYATGLSLFPRPGSHNGGLATAALAIRLARELVHA